MILHMFPKSKFSEGFINFINQYFDSKEHVFVLYTNGSFKVSPELYKLENVIDYDEKNIFWLYKNIKKADRFFLHNLSVNIYELFMFFLFPRFLKKCIWLIWGGDLYCYRNPRKRLVDRAVELMRRRVIRKIAVIASLTEGDYRLAQQWYGVDTTHIRLDYCIENIYDILTEILRKKIKKDSTTLNIIVGNSATDTNKHMEAFEKLKEYAEQDIRVYVPLSYGDMEYGQQVEIIGKDYFGEKFIPLKTYMTQEKYFYLLNDMDIAIFNNDRQQGIGNIMALALLGKKVYLREKTSMWDEWVEQGQFVFHGMDELGIEFSEFVRLDEKEVEQNKKAAQNYYDSSQRVEEWRHAFEMQI